MKKTIYSDLSKRINISKARGLEAVLKAELISGILKASKEQELTHEEISKRSGLPRSAVNGILSGSLQKVSIDRDLKLLESVGLTIKARIKKAV
jgi:predicted XRE-type DNA-binding protein